MNIKTKNPPDLWKEKKKLLTTAIKKTVTHNAILPILGDVLLDGTHATVSDLENFVVIPFECPGIDAAIPSKKFIDCLEMMDHPKFGIIRIPSTDKNEPDKIEVTISEGKRVVKLRADHSDDYPRTWTESDYNHIGTFTEAELGHLATALGFVSNDDLRPAMTGIMCGNVIVATDAHRLFWKDIDPLMEEFILPPSGVKTLLALGGERWELYWDGNRVLFIREDGVMLLTRVIDARFPDYKVVIPDYRAPGIKLIAGREIILKELKNASKFANKTTKMCTFTLNGKITIAAADIDFDESYQSELAGADAKFYPKNRGEFTLKGGHAGYKGQVVQINGNVDKESGKVKVGTYQLSEQWLVHPADLVPLPDYLQIAFNGDFISEIISKIPKDEIVTIKMWSPTKAAIINDQFLVMPLMLNS